MHTQQERLRQLAELEHDAETILALIRACEDDTELATLQAELKDTLDAHQAVLDGDGR